MAYTLETLAAMLSETPDIGKAAIRAGAPAVEVVVKSGIMEGFDKSQAPDGTAWAPLKFPRVTGGGKPLRDKGLLAASTSAQVTEDEIIMRANAPGARLHHFGGIVRPKNADGVLVFKVGKSATPKRRGKANSMTVFAKKVTIPARPYLGIGDATLQRILRIVSEKYVAIVTRSRGA